MSSDPYTDYAAFEAEELAKGRCPVGGGQLRLEQWDSHGPTMACAMCDCFGFDPTDPRLLPVGASTRREE